MPALKSERWKKLKSDWYILLTALVLSFFIWIVYGISVGYDTFIQYSVELTSPIPGYEDKSVSNELLVLQGKGDGYYILLQKLSRKNTDRISIEVDPSLLHPDENVPDRFYLLTSDIGMEVAKALSGRFEPDFFETKRLSFDFAPQSFKTVPIEVKCNVSCKSQYMLTSEVEVTPAYVRIYGNTKDIARVDVVRTKFLSLSSVDRSETGSVALEPVKGLRLEYDRVNYSFSVARYVEQTAEVEVSVLNAPSDRELLVLPSKVTVVYRTAFADKNASFIPEVAVDYDDYLASRSGKVIPHIMNAGDNLLSYEIAPLPLECILTVR